MNQNNTKTTSSTYNENSLLFRKFKEPALTPNKSQISNLSSQNLMQTPNPVQNFPIEVTECIQLTNVIKSIYSTLTDKLLAPIVAFDQPSCPFCPSRQFSNFKDLAAHLKLHLFYLFKAHHDLCYSRLLVKPENYTPTGIYLSAPVHLTRFHFKGLLPETGYSSVYITTKPQYKEKETLDIIRKSSYIQFSCPSCSSSVTSANLFQHHCLALQLDEIEKFHTKVVQK